MTPPSPEPRAAARRPARRRRSASAPPRDDPAAAAGASPPAAPADARWTALAIFLLAFLLRLLFWQATPDAAWPYSAYYKGDALVWLSYVDAIRHGQPFELGLPLRPPGAAYLLHLAWDGTAAGIWRLKLLWCALGALAVVATQGAAARAFGRRVGLVTGLLAAASSGLLVLSTSLDNETPYLVVVGLTLWLWPGLPRSRPRAWEVAAWSALGAAGCLLRAEHALFYFAASAWIGATWLRGARPWHAALRPAALAVAVFVLALLPWHLTAWRMIARFNEQPPVLNPATERAQRAIEQAVAHLPFDAGAEAERARLPAFCRRSTGNFVAATALVRGRDRVTAADFAVLEEAFGYRPRPVAAHPFVAIYGGLNFWLANNPGADGGFGRAPLEQPPPLAGGPSRYPLPLVQGLPPGDLALEYPPHLAALNQGYRLGWRWISSHPAAYLRLAVRKLAISWAGAATGFTGYNLPLGMSGLRRPVDLVVAEGRWATAWRWLVLALCVGGGVAGARRGGLAPWLLYLGSKVVVTLAFFGYARQGASALPVVVLLLALAADRLPRAALPAPLRRLALAAGGLAPVLVAGVLLLGVEATRWAGGPELLLDGRPVGVSDPFPPQDHLAHRLVVR